MVKKWFWILVIVLITVFSSSVYSKLSENEKSKLEKCPLKTYVNVTGNGIWSKGCFDVTIEKGYNELYVDTICDWFTIDPFTEKGLGENLGEKDQFINYMISKQKIILIF